MNTITVGAAILPTIVQTYISHYLNRKFLHHQPTAHISYHEGLLLIRRFLVYASHHTVEQVQAFTSQWVPHPHWVHVEEVVIPESSIVNAAETLIYQLGPRGIEQVGGKKWWQWRQSGSNLQAEWIEMRTDYNQRKERGEKGDRIVLYIHGGAYFFGSNDEHRFQLQRHARKLQARVFAPEYRLAPQFPFPCGLQDCLAAYLYLLTIHDPSQIIFSGDSAGGGMIVSMLVTLRDQGLPLPAGAVLISPWVDLTHSFPSLAEDDSKDYIPSHGFMQRPSESWPPPTAEEMKSLIEDKDDINKSKVSGKGIDVHKKPEGLEPPTSTKDSDPTYTSNVTPKSIPNLSVMIDGDLVEIKDQIHMYAPNDLLSHPLVSPALQPSLGGLPPLIVLTGGGEILRDEQIYLAHKAASPAKYPPADTYLDSNPGAREAISKWKPTDVQLQVWDDLCHVPTTLSFTRPAKLMYRSIAQFSAWALARAQNKAVDILDDDEISMISSTSSSSSNAASKDGSLSSQPMVVGQAGDPLPNFHQHMIRQQVSQHGVITPLPAISELPALQLHPSEVGFIKPGPARNWLAAKAHWDKKYHHDKVRIHKDRLSDMVKGYEGFDGEIPPPSALAGRRKADMTKERPRRKSWGMSMWSGWGSKHDFKTLEREEKADAKLASVAKSSGQSLGANSKSCPDLTHPSASRSRRRAVVYEGQLANKDTPNENTSVTTFLESASMGPDDVPDPINNDDASVTADEPSLERDTTFKRPLFTTTEGKMALPFKLRDENENASTLTLTSHAEGDTTPVSRRDDESIESPSEGTKKETAESSINEGNSEKQEGGSQRPVMERFVTAVEAL